MRPIETAETGYYPFSPPDAEDGAPLPAIPAAERVLMAHWTRRDVAPFRPQGVAAKITAYAEVNHGRWIVRCPFCASAQFAAKTDRRFFCVECLNEQVGRRWVRVVWPAEVEAIEAALLARPERDFMQWHSGQPVVQLLRENAAGFHHSWTSPRDWVVGEVITASICNTHIRDNLNETIPARAVDAVLAAKFFW